MEINKLKILYDAIRPAEEPTIENPTKEDVVSMLNFAVHYMEDGLDGVLDAMKEYAELHIKLALVAALESIPCLGSSSDIASYEEVEYAVLNSYPESNIE